MKEINKEEFKKEVEDYVKVLFRKTIKEADQQQLFQQSAVAFRISRPWWTPFRC